MDGTRAEDPCTPFASEFALPPVSAAGTSGAINCISFGMNYIRIKLINKNSIGKANIARIIEEKIYLKEVIDTVVELFAFRLCVVVFAVRIVLLQQIGQRIAGSSVLVWMICSNLFILV